MRIVRRASTIDMYSMSNGLTGAGKTRTLDAFIGISRDTRFHPVIWSLEYFPLGMWERWEKGVQGIAYAHNIAAMQYIT